MNALQNFKTKSVFSAQKELKYIATPKVNGFGEIMEHEWDLPKEGYLTGNKEFQCANNGSFLSFRQKAVVTSVNCVVVLVKNEKESFIKYAKEQPMQGSKSRTEVNSEYIMFPLDHTKDSYAIIENHNEMDFLKNGKKINGMQWNKETFNSKKWDYEV